MAYRLKFSTRVLREIGEAQEWYELQSPGLGEEFIAAIELQVKMAMALKSALALLVSANVFTCYFRPTQQ
jgi:hypothetical protein